MLQLLNQELYHDELCNTIDIICCIKVVMRCTRDVISCFNDVICSVIITMVVQKVAGCRPSRQLAGRGEQYVVICCIIDITCCIIALICFIVDFI